MLNNSFQDIAKTDYGYKASLLDFSDAKTITVPDQINDEIPTMNQQGFMKLDLDEYSQAFIDRSEFVEYSIDIGCAYGFVAKQALARGNKVIAFDLDINHLKLLGSEVDKQYLDNLYLIEGVFPKEFHFDNKNIGSVLASRIMHFLGKEEFVMALQKIYKALVFGGKFFFTSVTPYHYKIKEGFLHKYLARKKNGDKWPGEIENQWEINPGHREYVHPFLHVFDISDIEAILPEYGFRIDKISLFDYPNDMNSEGKGHIGFEATKI